MPVQLDRLQVRDPELNRVQDNIVQTLNPVLLNPLLGGRLIQGVVFAAGVSKDVAHGLDKIGVSYIPVAFYSVGGSPALWDARETLIPRQQRLFLRLTCASDATVDLFVF